MFDPRSTLEPNPFEGTLNRVRGGAPRFYLTPDATLWEDATALARARTCNDCFFRRKGLCALATETPCPTFREMRAGRITAPKQPALVAPTSEGRVVVAALSR